MPYSAEIALPIFTKILQDIVALVALLNHAYTRRYPVSFLNVTASNVRSLPFFAQNWLPKLVAMAKSHEISEKDVQIDHVHS